MRVVITGAGGFLGSHLCDRFVEEGHEVVAMDNFITGAPDNLEHLIGRDDFRLVRHDVTEFIYVQGAVDGVLHLASPASPVDYLELPIKTLKVGSLGTHKTLGLAKAKDARYLLASTSEVYGDPQEHPQRESYWGHVNPIGPRGVYDEAKRFAEAMTMAYHREHGVDTRIARIFNSVLAHETVFLFNDREVHIESVGEYADSVAESDLVAPRTIQVPAFDPATLEVQLRTADCLIKHPSGDKDAYRIRTRYGRDIEVTGDHSVFRKNAEGRPEAVPVRRLEVGDHVAIPGRLPVVEKDREEVDIAESLLARSESSEELWGYALCSPALKDVLREKKEEIFAYLMESPRYDGSTNKRNTVGCAWRKWADRGVLPLSVAFRLRRSGGWHPPEDATIRPYTAGKSTGLPNRLPVTDDLLWLLGLFLAEGCHVDREGTYRILISSDARFVERASRILEDLFSVRPRRLEWTEGKALSLYVDSKLLVYLFRDVFGVTGYSGDLRIPPWIFQLPLGRVKHFLKGYRQGDGTHTDYPEGRELAFNTVSEKLATDLTYLLLRFGIVASVGRYETRFREKYGDRKFPFWRVTVCEVSDFDILSWDEGVEQTLNATRSGDLVWAKVNEIEEVDATDFVYDFSVEGHENFVAGNGVFAHNTYGPRMRPDDGRVVSNFIVQSLRGDPLTVYGDGDQTRSFCYVSDLIDGLYRLFLDGGPEPVNLGNPDEFTILELAELVTELTGSGRRIEHLPLPEDDPQVRRPDISRARETLGWTPEVPLREGLERTIAYFRELEAAGRLPEARVLAEED